MNGRSVTLHAPPGSVGRPSLVLALLVVTGSLASVGASIARTQLVHRAAEGVFVVLVDDGYEQDPRWSDLRRDEGRVDIILLVRWLRDCNTLGIASVPRDLVLDAAGDQLSVDYGTNGAGSVMSTLGRAFDVKVIGGMVVDLDDVAVIASRLGPVDVNLPEESQDRRTGFRGGPGVTRLDARNVVAFLRSRTWEVWGADGWEPGQAGDTGRISRLQTYLNAALTTQQDAGLDTQASTLGVTLARATFHVRDYLATIGLTMAIGRGAHVVFGSVPGTDETSVDDRRSPFAPSDFGAAYRLRPTGDLTTALPTCASVGDAHG